MKYEFHPETAQELADAAAHYESGLVGLGSRFVDEVFRVVQLFLDNPELGSRVDENLRHFVLRRFPFSIVYSASAGLVYIVAVAHGSREPGYWQQRVQDR